MSHSASWWSRDTGDERNNWLASSVVLLQEIGSLLLSRSSDLSDHDDTIGLSIFKEDSQAVDEVGSGEWVTTDTDDKGLAKTALGGLVDGLVGKSSGTGDDTDAAALVDETWHDTDLALAWGDDTWAVRSDQAGLVLGLQDVGDADHVVLWDTLGNTAAVLGAVLWIFHRLSSIPDNEWHLGGNGLLNTSSGHWRWNEDGRCICASLLHCLLNRRPDWKIEVLLAGLLWVGASNNICA